MTYFNLYFFGFFIPCNLFSQHIRLQLFVNLQHIDYYLQVSCVISMCTLELS